jgi:hypothetical protein
MHRLAIEDAEDVVETATDSAVQLHERICALPTASRKITSLCVGRLVSLYTAISSISASVTFTAVINVTCDCCHRTLRHLLPHCLKQQQLYYAHNKLYTTYVYEITLHTICKY